MTTTAPPIAPIPTALGLRLFESLLGGGLAEIIADMTGDGATLAGEDGKKVRGTTRKNINLWNEGRNPRPSTVAALQERCAQALRHKLQQLMPDEPDAAEQIFQRFANATGPFIGLSAIYLPASLNGAQQNLLDFSGNLDQLGTQFMASREADNIDRAKEMFLGINWLDQEYWTFPEPELKDPQRNLEAVRRAADWPDLERAYSPLLLNSTLNWLSWLDLAVLTSARNQQAFFSLFLPLAARFTPKAAAAFENGALLQVRDWTKVASLPVRNLIGLIRNISLHAEREAWEQRARPAPRRAGPKPKRKPLSDTAKRIATYQLLSFDDFRELLTELEPDEVAERTEMLRFDIKALLPATNLFSLLVFRDGKAAKNDSRPKKPKSLTVSEHIRDRYEFWWRRNLKDLAGDVGEHPQPEWYVRSLGGGRCKAPR